MKKYLLESFGGPEVLQLKDHPTPDCPADGYLVEARAMGLNFAETVERRGEYSRGQKCPFEIGKEAAGVVVAAGPQTSRFQVGDEVIVIKFSNGCYSEIIVANDNQLLEPPRGLSWNERAAFANTFGTAWFALQEIARVRAGESALVQAAAGGVGTATVMLAKALGMGPIIGTAGTDEKCALVESHGADACVNYTSHDFRDKARELTEGLGVDYCIESVGGEVYDRSLELLAPLGRMVIIGFSSIRDNYAEAIPRLHPLTVFHRSITVGGLNVDNIKYHHRRANWAELVTFAEKHDIRPHIGNVFAFDDAAGAHTCLERRQSVGKVVLSVA
ncbi:MAG: NADPH:quinone oxidoreductase family protein [Planctomycetes bacterium]|nr:NADPH:quinone oxidoreductase family protein [Planctomycetota bacterium]MBT4028008.1 NADPH:quinone oxidoreductase family protein [Planctomycetota bacterium]MBT4561102.1 NADPH:quinone oxidoreductase family protein [Planctomycetota bacterium]MBT5100646.1 NADPH:quinone oxidoreductase family protein [Planctomycetota bacterium]MBT7012199.1 NADPH:quinone oxidoreductase family protein [Planctomycetota bacterium]